MLQIPIIFFALLFFQFPSIYSTKSNAKNSLEPILPFQNSPQSPGAIVEENETSNGKQQFTPLLRNGQLVNANFNNNPPKDRPLQGTVKSNSPQEQQQKTVAAELSGKDGNGRLFHKRFNAIIEGQNGKDKLELGGGNGGAQKVIRDGDTDGTAKRSERAELREKPVGDELNGKNQKESGNESKKEETKKDEEGTTNEELAKEEKAKEEVARKSEEFNTFSFLPSFFGRALGIPKKGVQPNETKKGENKTEESNNKIGQEVEKVNKNEKTFETKPSGGTAQLAVDSTNSSVNVVCEDLAENCAENRAFCAVSPYEKLMADNCAQTCGKCEGNKESGNGESNEEVEDKNDVKSDGNQEAEEEKPTKITKQQDEGPECKDFSIRCDQWAQRGFCTSRFFHRDLKTRFCAKTCSFCGQ